MITKWTRADYEAATAHDDAVRAQGDAIRARDDARRARVADAIRARGDISDPVDIAARAAAVVAAWDDASYNFDAGRTMVYDAHAATRRPEAEALDALAPTPTATNKSHRSYLAARRPEEEELDALEASLREQAAARASWETPMPPKTDPWADQHGGPAGTPSTPSTPSLLETLISDFGAETAFQIWQSRRRPSPCRPQLWAAQAAHHAASVAEQDAIADAKEARLARRAARANVAEARAAVAVARAAELRARV